MSLRRTAPWTIVLTTIWVLLNGRPQVANVLGGLAVSAIVLIAFPLAEEGGGHRFHPVATVAFALHVAWSLVTSSLAVALAVVAPTPARLRSGIVRVELPGASPLVTTLVANAITLTPGTLTVTAQSDPAVLHVHVLGLGDVDEFRASIHDLHRRAAAAFTPVGEAP
ncbi:cation:proton antiporter [Iamia sp. SCSIO 61187]|uniref:Na+/H+ antiporter subunit E n=1 Tax=Iamia sp. SCSIO 61187 TaxID=2722752 RepID=UPI001C62DDA3|nr:Na+/H+ antiporter subunit E [Iamia sp. SCSIO 61187]QYG91195.1 cation:proton antiporter [Iamia sp. SCSIO 61187]